MDAQQEVRRQLLAGLPVDERRLDLAGISTAVLEGGEGPPVVMLSGPGAAGVAWMRVIPALARRHRVIAPDLPGQGASAAGSGSLDVGRVLEWTDELIERTCPSPPVIVGQLIGGAIAARFALENADRIDRLVLVVPFGLAEFEPSPAFGSALGRYLAEPNGDTHDGLWEQCVLDLDGLRGALGSRWESIKAYNLDRSRTPSLAAPQAQLMESFAFPAIPSESLARIAVPTSLIWGRHDSVVSLSIGEAASSRYRWPLNVVENAGNEPALEAPDAFLRALSAGLEARVEVTA